MESRLDSFRCVSCDHYEETFIEAGVCRLHPPVTLMQPGTIGLQAHTQPHVERDDRCGEHSEIKERT